jgi:TetR/AcrR family transcriptional repressor of nem operon
MARPKEFDRRQALDAAVSVFREHGFEGSSASMLVDAMKIGRQSVYDTFGDKWQLYLASVQHYASAETGAHIAALRSAPRAIDGIRAMIERVIAEAREPCLGVGSICEFGESREDLSRVHAAAGRTLRAAIILRLREAQAQQDVAPEFDPEELAGFLIVNIAGIRIAARGGADDGHLRALGALALRALR